MTPDLAALHSDIGALLARAVKDRRSAFHTPVIATRGVDGLPKARIVVLRAYDPAAGTLRFHTDKRGNKIAELAADPHLSFAFYDSHARIQIRVETRAHVHADDATADAAWAGSQRMSRVCYGVTPAPGTPIPSADEFHLPDNDETIAAGRSNFTAIVCTIMNLEYLFLRHEGHQRARFTRDGEGWQGVWLAP